MMKSFVLSGVILISGLAAFSQDSSRKKEVNITSTFKPSLKEAAKINFNATAPVPDTTRPRLQYTLPNQNLNFAFQPGVLKPLALQVDTGGRWSEESYVKLGYGNFKSPFMQAGISFGDGRDVGLNIYARHNSSKGTIPYQDYGNSAIDLSAFFKASNNEWNIRFGGFQETYNKYGYEPKTLKFPDDSINVKFQTWRARVGMNNINTTDLGISYSPELKIEVFNDQLSNSESNTYLNLPIQKRIGETFEVDMALTANLSRYKPQDKKDIVNNYFEFSPSVLYKKPQVLVQAGLRPAWDNGNFKLFPNALVEFNTTDKRFAVQVGFTGHMRNSGYEYLAGFNPWIWAPATVYNTKITERFAGIKGSIGDHFSYSAKAAYNQYSDQPLFVNDTSSGKSFRVVNESNMKYMTVGGELGYNVGEKLSIVSNISFNNWELKDNVKAWGLIPLEWKTDLRVQVLKDLYVNTTLYAFDGPWSLTKAGRKNLPAATDLSAGFEFKVVKNVKLWAQFNNLFNKEYQRWNQYPVYGFNFLGGVVFSFAQKN
jgi:hypothetical protein